MEGVFSGQDWILFQKILQMLIQQEMRMEISIRGSL